LKRTCWILTRRLSNSALNDVDGHDDSQSEAKVGSEQNTDEISLRIAMELSKMRSAPPAWCVPTAGLPASMCFTDSEPTSGI